MEALKKVFALYIQGSVHVALAVLSLVLMTNHMFTLPFNAAMGGFAFFGTLFSYNFMKYESLYRFRKPVTPKVRAIVALSLASLAAAGTCFLFLERVTQAAAVIFLGLTALYVVPFSPGKKNLRNLSGIKIYIVALCWAGVTTLLPLLNAGFDLMPDVYLKFGQRFLLVLILILIFEIIDLAEDDPHLKTLPQVIGVKNTKIVNLLLLIPFYGLEFFKSTIDTGQLFVNILLVAATALFTLFATPERNKYYTLFWVESIPIFWLVMVVLAGLL